MAATIGSLQIVLESFLEDLATRAKNIGTELRAVENVDSVEYKRGLYDELAAITKLMEEFNVKLQDIGAQSVDTTPFEIVTEIIV